MAQKKRGNDAVPTWSGFNYQGKITLLCVLIEINKLIESKLELSLLDNCYVEIEKTEDFVLFIHGKVTALFQVKAYLSTDKTSSFNNAMKKLIEHRSDLKNLAATCYICAPLTISDWNDTGNTYKNQIELFFYDNKPVHVTQVAQLIKLELCNTLRFMGLSSLRADDIYLGLCELLDKKVAEMHNQSPEARNYNFLFIEIVDFIFRANVSYIVEEETRQKENIYKHIIEGFKDVIQEYCHNECEDKQMGICKKDIYGTCALTTSYDYILEINIWEYCKYLNPHITTGWDKQLSYVQRLRTDEFKRLLLPIFYKINETALHSDEDTIFCETDLFKTVKNKVIPTLLTFDAGYNDFSKSKSDTLAKIKQNGFLSSSSIVGCTITADTKGEQYNTENDSILYFEKDTSERITNNENYIKIVDGKEFIKLIGGK